MIKIGLRDIAVRELIIWIFIIHFAVGALGALFSIKLSKSLKIKLYEDANIDEKYIR